MTTTHTQLASSEDRTSTTDSTVCSNGQTRPPASLLAPLEGRRVNVALLDGQRLYDYRLVSAGRGRTPTLWLFANGSDIFVAADDVTDIWPARDHLGRSLT